MATERIATILTLLTGSLVLSSALGQQATNDSFVIRDVRLFDGERVTENRSVVVVDGRVSQISGSDLNIRGLSVVDGEGRTLLPGFFDTHVHLPGANPAEALAQSVRFGVTTVVDMFSSGATLRAIRELQSIDDPQHSSIIMAGTGATAPGGHPSQMTPESFSTIAGPEQAQSFVEARLAEGSNFLKVIYDDLPGNEQSVPMLDRATLEALVGAAHDNGILAVAHISRESYARDAIDAGVDGIAHLFNGNDVSEDFGEFVSQHGAFVIPTISILHVGCGNPDGPDLVEDSRIGPYITPDWRRLAVVRLPTQLSCAAIGPAIQQLSAAEVPILVGTDAAIPGTAYGASVHGELEAMVNYGLSPIEALVAATSAPARAFGLSDRGMIRVGMRADLLLVDGNPTTKITDSRNIERVWKHGISIRRDSVD
jgi:imidazolonepropionase-like amidohydrolase